MLKRKLNKSIRFRFMCVLAGVLCLGTISTSLIVVIYEEKAQNNFLKVTGHSFASYIGKLSKEPLIAKNRLLLDAIVDDANKDENIAYTVVSDERGIPLTTRFASFNYRLPMVQAILLNLSRDLEIPEIIEAIRKTKQIVEVSMPITIGVKTIGTVTVGMSDFQMRQKIIQTIAFIILFNIAVAFVLGGVLFVASQKIVFDPLFELGQASSRLARGDLSTVVEIETTGEVKTLVDSFNEMVRNLEKVTVSRDYVDNIIRSMINTLIVTTPDNKITSTNAAACNLLGYEEQELIGRPAETIFSQGKSKRAVWMKTLLAEGRVANIEESYRTKDGRDVPVLFSASALYGDQRLQQGIVYVAQDITEHKRAQNALEESLSLFKATLESTTDGILVVNRQRRIVSANHQFKEIWRLPEEVVASGDAEQVLAYVTDQLADPQGFLQRVKKIYSEPAAESYDILNFKDGRVFERYSLPQYLDNQIVGRVWSFRDVTARVQAERALRRAKEEWELTFDAVPELIMILDENHQVRQVNRAMAEALHSTPDALIGRHCYELMHRTNGPSPFCPHGKTLADGLIHTTEIKELGLDLLVTTSPLKDSDGWIIGSVHMARDLTESKKAEAEFLRISKLESLATLAGGIAHDFNNTLMAIRGNISLAMMNQEPDYNKRVLAAAEVACQQAQGLAHQLLTFAKGGAPIKAMVSINKLVFETGSFACRGANVKCEFNLPVNLWAAEVDSGQIGQVIQNLVINAIQAMPAGGTVQVQGENLVVEAESSLPLEPGNYVRISIKDQGAGIPADLLPRIFDPYFTTKQKGSGLGLATTYSIVRKHHGHIVVDSKLGAGTTFQIYLPAGGRVKIETAAKEIKTLKGQGKILLMDDEEMVRRVVGGMLNNLGYEMEFAVDGVQALEKFSQAKTAGLPFAAVILDLTVPGGMGGKKAIEELLKIDPQVKAIVSSGYSDDPIMADFKKYGFAAVIAKPYTISDLGEVLKEVFTGEK